MKSNGMSRREFLGAGAVALGAAGMVRWVNAGEGRLVPAPVGGPPVRIAKIYFGTPHPGWPKATVDLAAEHARVEKEMRKVAAGLPDVEFLDCGLVSSSKELSRLQPLLKKADGILILQLTMGMGWGKDGILPRLLETGLPTVLFAEPYCGHEWHTVASFQRLGKKLDCWASSRFEDVAAAIRPIRAARRLRDAKILYISPRPLDPNYARLIREKFGTQIIALTAKQLEAAYQAIPETAAATDAETWMANAEKIVEPSRQDIFKAARMALAVEKLTRDHQAAAIAIDCLAMGLIQKGMGYPCFGFSRLNSMGLGGICEADLKSAMTHLIFLYLTGRPGFINDPCFDYSNKTMICAHCVAAVKMLGPEGPTHPYIIRSHLEDDKSAVLQVRLPASGPVSMARLIGADILLFSTGEAVDSPLVDRGCRSKVTVKLERPEKFLENWSCGLHRVIFYGDHTRDIERFCRLMNIRLVREGTDEPQKVKGLEWKPVVHA
ncbi:MAG: hypothetical protein J7M29_04655 [Verrucomicrobia bacterium]|nr:hypothetical protein [Verrucomicrobiota bacterium]